MDFFKNRAMTRVDWIIIGASLFVLVLITLVYFVVVNVVRGQIDGVQAQINAKQTEVSDARAVAAKRDALVIELAQVRKKISRFEDKLPTEKEVPRLLNQFQQIAELSGVKYQKITAEPVDEKELYVRLPFKVKVAGTYPVVGEFLRSLEFGNRFIKIEDVDIGPEKKGESEANFVICTYMFVIRDQANESGVKQS